MLRPPRRPSEPLLTRVLAALIAHGSALMIAGNFLAVEAQKAILRRLQVRSM